MNKKISSECYVTLKILLFFYYFKIYMLKLSLDEYLIQFRSFASIFAVINGNNLMKISFNSKINGIISINLNNTNTK